jgi:MFS family permease
MIQNRSLLLAIYIPSFLLAVGQQAVMLLLPLHILQLQGSMGMAAAIVGLRGVGMMLIDVPAGMLTTRFGDRNAMLAALVGNLMTVLAFAFVHHFAALMIVALLYGVGSGAWLTARLSYVADACNPAIRGRAIATLAGIRRGGTLLGPAMGGFLAHAYSYEAAFMMTGMLMVIAIILIVLFAEQGARHEKDSTPHLDRLLGVLTSNSSAFMTAGMGALAIMLVRAARQLLIPLFGAAIGINAAAIGLIYSLSMVVDLMMFYPAGLLMDKRGRRQAAIPCVGLLALSLALLPLTGNFTELLLVALLAGLGNGLGTGVVMTIGTDLAPLHRRGEFLGVWRLLSDLGSTIGPLLISGLTKLYTLSAATLSASGIGVAGLVLFLFIRETRQPHDVKSME